MPKLKEIIPCLPQGETILERNDDPTRRAYVYVNTMCKTFGYHTTVGFSEQTDSFDFETDKWRIVGDRLA